MLGGTSNSTTSPIGNSASLLLGRGGICGTSRGGLSRSSPNTNSPLSRLPAWALDDEDFSSTTPTDSSGLHLSTFGTAATTSLGDDEDTFGTSASSGSFSLESMAAATLKMNETWKHQLSKNKLSSDLGEELEPSSKQGEDIDWDSQWYYMSEDNEMKGPYSLQKLKEWMELSYLQSDTIVKKDLDSTSTRTLGDVLNNVMPTNEEAHQRTVTTSVNTAGIITSESPLMSNLLMGSSSYGLSSVVSPTSPLLSSTVAATTANTGSGSIGMVSSDFSSSFRTESSTTRIGLNEPSPFLTSGTSSLPINAPLQGSLLNSLTGEKSSLTPTTTQPPSLPITPTPTPTNLSQSFSHSWGFSQQPPSIDPTLNPVMHPHHGYPFMSPGMVNLPPFGMPPFMHQQNAWGMPSNLLGLGGNVPQSGQMPVSVTDIENELLFVPQHPSVDFQQQAVPSEVAADAVHHDEQQQVEQEQPIVVSATQTSVPSPQLGVATQPEDKTQHEEESPTTAEEHAHNPQEEVSKEQQHHEEPPQEKTPKSKSSKKSTASSGKKEPASKATTTTEKQTKKQPELPSLKPEPVFKAVPPSEVVSFAEPPKKEEKGWGVTATTAPVPTLKQIMEQQKKEAIKLNKEAQKKKEAEQSKAVNSANPWGVVTVGAVNTPSIKEIQEEEAKKKKQNAQKQAQNQAAVLKKATTSSWGPTATHQFKAIPNDVTSTSTSTPTFFGSSSTPTKVETKTFQFQAIKPQPVTSTTTTTTNSSNSPTEEEEESPFWEYTAPAITTPAVVITNASDKKKKDKKKKTPSNEKPSSFASSVGTATTSNTTSSQQTSSITSNNGASEELSVSQDFKDWFKKGLKKLNKSVDPPSFMNLLLSLNSDKEIMDYMSDYIGNSSAAQKFAQEFLANKSFETLPNQGTKKKK